MKVTIHHKFPGLNEVIAVAQKDKRKKNRKGDYIWESPYGDMKRKYSTIAYLHFLNKGQFKGKVNIHFHWIGNRKRDPDNISVGKKFILDGMVKAGTIKNDSQKYIGRLSDSFGYGKSDSVEIEIQEI